jgi:GT2 family glycosyltransferase
MTSVDVVIPTHNNWDHTKSCLEHLQLQTRAHTVFLCDNGSTDGTPELARDQFPEVRIVELGANLGFPAACNRGVNAGDSEIVVLLNNDVECHSTFLEHLVAPFDREERLGSVAALLVEPGERRIESFGIAVDPTLAGFPRLRGCPPSEAQALDPLLAGPYGAAGAYRRRAWEEVGGLDEGVFAYGEDTDLALQLRAAQWSTAAVAAAVAVHVGSATASRRSDWQRYQSGFGRAYFLRRYGVHRTRFGVRAALTEALVITADAVLFSHDLTAFRSRLAGWRAANDRAAKPRPPREAIDYGITFRKSLRLRLGLFKGFTHEDQCTSG